MQNVLLKDVRIFHVSLVGRAQRRDTHTHEHEHFRCFPLTGYKSMRVRATNKLVIKQTESPLRKIKYKYWSKRYSREVDGFSDRMLFCFFLFKRKEKQ